VQFATQPPNLKKSHVGKFAALCMTACADQGNSKTEDNFLHIANVTDNQRLERAARKLSG
jgi:hypothetical protein